MALEFPPLDPVAFSFGSLVVRWYALAYLAGFILGWRYCMGLTDRYRGESPNRRDIDDFLTWAVIAVIFGGRLGYVLFYQTSFYWDNPIEILKVWHGGMSFHGGMLGMILAAVVFCAIHKIPTLRLMDVLCAGAPIGLFFGRLANFVNAELYGRVTNLPFGMVFPNSDGLPRHPSQLYEAGLEGVVIFGVLAILASKTKAMEKEGVLAGVFLLLYGMFRALIEFVREPDANIGLLFGGVMSMGQVLCLPMVFGGAVLIHYALTRNDATKAKH